MSGMRYAEGFDPFAERRIMGFDYRLSGIIAVDVVFNIGFIESNGSEKNYFWMDKN